MQTQWEKSLSVLREKISNATFSNLFSKLSIISLNKNQAVVIVPADLDLKEIAPYKLLTELSWEEANGNQVDISFRHTAPPIQNNVYSSNAKIGRAHV